LQSAKRRGSSSDEDDDETEEGDEPEGEDEESEEEIARRKDAWWTARHDRYRSKLEGESLNYRNRFSPFILAVIDGAGALLPPKNPGAFEGYAPPCDGDLAPRGPDGQVATCKFQSNDGRHITREECTYIADRITTFLATCPTIKTDQCSYVLRADPKDPDDRGSLEF